MHLQPMIFYDNSVNLSKNSSLVHHQGGGKYKEEWKPVNMEECISPARNKRSKNEDTSNSSIVKQNTNDTYDTSTPSCHMSL